jgi:hypothetical protein
VTAFTFADLERAISPGRSARYLQSTADPVTGATNDRAALELYERNARLSADVWVVIADIEIVLRNIVADAVRDHHSAVRPGTAHRWYDDPSWFTNGKWFSTQTLRSINVAKNRVNDPGVGAAPRPPEGRVIAELTLGFWRYLLIARYEHSLWNPAIRAQFPALSHLSGTDSRRQVYDRTEKLKALRNRVAHHEPIYEPFLIPNHATAVDPMHILREATEMISWANPDAASWIESRSALSMSASRWSALAARSEPFSDQRGSTGLRERCTEWRLARSPNRDHVTDGVPGDLGPVELGTGDWL